MAGPVTRTVRLIVGDQQVSGLVTTPERPFAGYVFAHGAGAGMNHAFMSTVAHGLAARGVCTLRFQFPYMEVGRRSPNPPKTLTATVESAYVFAENEFGGVPIFAGGKSLGGRMTSTLASEQELTRLSGLVFFGFPLHAAGRPSAQRAAHLHEVNVPMLFVQGTRDRLADLNLLKTTLESVATSTTILEVEDGDHSLRVPKRAGRSNADVLADVVRDVVHWMQHVIRPT